MNPDRTQNYENDFKEIYFDTGRRLLNSWGSGFRHKNSPTFLSPDKSKNPDQESVAS